MGESEQIGVKRIVGPTIQLRSGAYFDFLDPGASEFTVRDVAHALGHLCRFTGHVHEFYSVAEHSYWCSTLVPRQDAMAALLHDAAEAFLGDVSRPLKSLLPDYKALEARVESAVLARFGLTLPLPKSVKVADLQMLRMEQLAAMRSDDDWPCLKEVDEPPIRLKFWSPEMARFMFLRRFEDLGGVIG